MRRRAKDATAGQLLHRRSGVARLDAPVQAEEQRRAVYQEDTAQTEEARQAEQGMPCVPEEEVQEEEQRRARHR